MTDKQGGEEFSECGRADGADARLARRLAIENALTFRALGEAQDELARRERRVTELNAQMQALTQASLALTTELSLERVLQKITDVARDVLGRATPPWA